MVYMFVDTDLNKIQWDEIKAWFMKFVFKCLQDWTTAKPM